MQLAAGCPASSESDSPSRRDSRMRPRSVEHQLFHQRVAQTHDRRALVLRFDLLRIERLADVADEHEPGDIRPCRFRDRPPLRRPRTSIPRTPDAAQRMTGHDATSALFPHPDDLAARRAEARPAAARHTTAHVWRPAPHQRSPQRRLRRVAERSAAMLPELRLDLGARLHHGVAHEHGRAAGRRRRVERHDRGVAHDDHDAIGG